VSSLNDIISCAMVAMSGIETYNPTKIPMKSCGFFGPNDDADGWREDRLGTHGSRPKRPNVCFSYITCCSLVGACRTSATYSTAMASKCGGWRRQRSDRRIVLDIYQSVSPSDTLTTRTVLHCSEVSWPSSIPQQHGPLSVPSPSPRLG